MSAPALAPVASVDPRFGCAQCHWSVGVTATTLACLLHERAAIRICPQFVYEPGSYEPEPEFR